jgi:hypothetical protein
MVKTMNDDWLEGVLDAHRISFSVMINLIGKKTKYVVFKPGILCSYVSDDFIKKLLAELDISAKSYKKTTSAKIIFLYKFEDIDKVIARMKNIDFLRKSTSFSMFIKAYEIIKKIGDTHKKWDERFREIITLKSKINSSYRERKNSLSDLQWENRIKEHLSYSTRK